MIKGQANAPLSGLTALWLALSGIMHPASADSLNAATGEVLLTVSGAIEHTNGDGAAALDRAMLAAMGMAEIKTSTIWTDGVQQFEGVPLATLLTTLGAQGGTLRATALNEYSIDIPMAEAMANGALLAFRMNGVDLSSRDKGPVWMVYPYDKGGIYRQEIIYAQSIWQLVLIDVLP